ncbi:MAG: hypothetical protein KDA57_10420 [Planctomycetales bacterium]|nr:hypothetical protein [Planctomycetales bacterium]
MSEHSFENAPDMGRDFRQSHDGSYEMPLEHDAARWEPTEELEIDRPSEKHLEMHFTPGGSLEQEVHTELDEAARMRIADAQRLHNGSHSLEDEKELNFSGDFDKARRNDHGWDPDSRREYEELSSDQCDRYDQDPFETGRRFEREVEREQGRDAWDR